MWGFIDRAGQRGSDEINLGKTGGNRYNFDLYRARSKFASILAFRRKIGRMPRTGPENELSRLENTGATTGQLIGMLLGGYMVTTIIGRFAGRWVWKDLQPNDRTRNATIVGYIVLAVIATMGFGIP